MNARSEASSKTTQAGTEPGASDGFVYLSAESGPLKQRQVGLVPGSDVPLLPVSLPAALQGYAREQVAQRQVCDRLGTKAEAIEVRPYSRSGERRTWNRTMVADPDSLRRWRELAGLGGRAVLPDYLALPAADGIWVLSDAAGMVLARLGPDDGFSATPSVATYLLRLALEEAETVPRALYAMSALPAAIEAMFAERDIPVVSAEADLRALQLEPPRRFAHGELACDLRLDPRAARNRLASRVLPWRWPLLAGLLAVGFWTATQIMAIDALREETAQVRAATLRVVREAFVPDGPILDVRTQVSRALAEARVAASGQGDRVAVLDLMGLISDVLMAEGANPVLLDYSADEAIRVVAQVADFAAAETLAGALREAGLEVRVVESRAEESNDGVSTELEISARDAGQSEERP